MKKALFILGAGMLLSTTSCEKKSDTTVIESNNDTITVNEDALSNDSNNENDSANNKDLVLNFSPASDNKLSGSAKLSQIGDEVTLKVDLEGLTPGPHAIHIHEKGDCSAPDASSAGAHWNPSNSEHGKFGENAYHMGDIGNLEANDEGVATLTFSTDKWCLGCDDDAKNIIGKSIIIHAGVDDFKSQPSGAAGDRIGCVVIE